MLFFPTIFPVIYTLFGQFLCLFLPQLNLRRTLLEGLYWKLNKCFFCNKLFLCLTIAKKCKKLQIFIILQIFSVYFLIVYFFLIFLLSFQSRLLFSVPLFLLPSEVSYMKDWFLAETSTSRFRISSDYVLMSERAKKPEFQVVTEVWSCFRWTISQSGDDRVVFCCLYFFES